MVAALQAETVAAEIKTAEMKKACIQMREAVVTQRQRRLVPQDGKKVLLHVAKKKNLLPLDFQGQKGEWLRVCIKFLCG